MRHFAATAAAIALLAVVPGAAAASVPGGQDIASFAGRVDDSYVPKHFARQAAAAAAATEAEAEPKVAAEAAADVTRTLRVGAAAGAETAEAAEVSAPAAAKAATASASAVPEADAVAKVATAETTTKVAAAADKDDRKWWRIYMGDVKWCLDVKDNDPSKRRVHMWGCHDRTILNQEWYWDPTTHTVTSMLSKDTCVNPDETEYCLEAIPTVGSELWLHPCDAGRVEQKFLFSDMLGAIKLEGNNDLCLAPIEDTPGNGGIVGVQACAEKTLNQAWFYEAAKNLTATE